VRFRSGSRITSQRLEAARRWMHRRENPLGDLEGPRAGMLQGFGIGAGREGKEAGQSPTVLPYGSPHSAAPQGLRLAAVSHWGLMLTLRHGVALVVRLN
jgi:hypothetical protein